MNKHQLAQELAVSEHLHLSTAVKAIDGLTRIIKETLAKGDVITLRGFGNLSVVDRPERTCRNPATGQPVIVPAHRNVRLSVASDFKSLLNPDNK